MSENRLRPIGTKFWQEYPFNPYSGEPEAYKQRTLYRVVSHELCGLYENSERTQMLEEIQAVEIQRAYCTGINLKTGEYEFGPFETFLKGTP